MYTDPEVQARPEKTLKDKASNMLKWYFIERNGNYRKLFLRNTDSSVILYQHQLRHSGEFVC